MKFSENPMKRSIPGRVGLFMKDDDMWVGNVDEVTDSDNLYRISYHIETDQENMNFPNSREIRSKALSANHSQDRIKVTESIQKSIENFRECYRK